MLLHMDQVNQKKIKKYIKMKKLFRRMLSTANITLKPHKEQFIVYVESTLPELSAYFSINTMTIRILNMDKEEAILDACGPIDVEKNNEYILVWDEEHARHVINVMKDNLSLISKSEPLSAEEISDLLFY